MKCASTVKFHHTFVFCRHGAKCLRNIYTGTSPHPLATHRVLNTVRVCRQGLPGKGRLAKLTCRRYTTGSYLLCSKIKTCVFSTNTSKGQKIPRELISLKLKNYWRLQDDTNLSYITICYGTIQNLL